jgi:cytidylate kinase
MVHDVSRLADVHAKEWALLEQVYAQRGADSQNSRVVPEYATITISREYGAGGHSVTEKIVQHLGADWQVWDKEIVEEIAKQANVRQKLAEALDEKMHSKAEQMLRYLTNYWGLSPDRYHSHLVEVLVNASHQGHKVIIGRGANFILPLALKVRLIASEQHRAGVVAERESITLEEAKEKVRTVDKERAEFIRSMFRRDINDSNAYDMTLRMENMSLDEAAAAISAAALEHIRKATLHEGRVFRYSI